MIKIILNTLLIVLISLLTKAQIAAKRLTVGDSVPDIYISKIINNKEGSAYLNEYNNSLLILDFWSTTCSACIEAMPEMQRLQGMFGRKLKILPVTFEKREVVKRFWQTNKYLKSIRLPSVVEDTLLNAIFPHKSYPHEVWIYRGKVIAITHSSYINKYNIASVLDGKELSLPLKYDYYYYDKTKPLFAIDTNQIDPINCKLYYVAMCDFINGVNSEGGSGGTGIIRDTVRKTLRYYFINQPIFNSYVDLLKKSLGSKTLIKPSPDILENQILWNVTDSTRYRFYNNQIFWDWILKNSVCYEQIQADTGQSDIDTYKSAIRYMNHLLGLNVYWSCSEQDVFVIKKRNFNRKHNLVNTISLSQLVYDFNNKAGNPYLFNETGDTEILVSKKALQLTSYSSLKSILTLSNLELSIKKKLVDRLVFTETPQTKIIDADMQDYAMNKMRLQESMGTPDSIAGKVFLNNNMKKKGVITTNSGLQYRILKRGNGRIPTVKDKILVHFEGTLVNGKVFDSSFLKGRPIEFYVKSVIPGWQEALTMMSEGSKWELYIPASLAYGAHTASGSIPRNSALVFSIQLLKVLN